MSRVFWDGSNESQAGSTQCLNLPEFDRNEAVEVRGRVRAWRGTLGGPAWCQASLSVLHGQICVDIQVFVIVFIRDTGVTPDMWSNITIHLNSS